MPNNDWGISAKIPEELFFKVKKLAKREGLSVSELVRQLLEKATEDIVRE